MCPSLSLAEEFHVDAFFDRVWHYQSIVGSKSARTRAEDCPAPSDSLNGTISSNCARNNTTGVSNVVNFNGSNSINLHSNGNSIVHSLSLCLSGSDRDKSNRLPGNPRGIRKVTGEPSPRQCPSVNTESRKLNIDTLLMQRVFSIFDENKDGQLSIQEIERFLKKLGLEMPPDAFSSFLTSTAAEPRTVHFHFDEFLDLFHSSSCNPKDPQQQVIDHGSVFDEENDLWGAFCVFDKNGDGLISPSELQTVLSVMGINDGEVGDYEKMIERVDLDGNGYVDFSEFKQMMYGNCCRCD